MFDTARVRQHLRDFVLTKIFIQELGWDHHTSRLEASVDGKAFALDAIAQKRGMVAFTCAPSVDGSFPAYQTRRKIERQVAKTAHEHLIIYTDTDKTTQIWQWVKREAGKPAACREHTYHRNQAGDALIQKLQAIVFTLEEEAKQDLSIVEVARRARAAFDVERVTKRFYDRFKSEHAVFLKFIKGIPDEELHRWYASVMLNRLMFIYFIQKKGFLDNDLNYLRNKLTQSQQRGRDRFYTEFLCRLFFEGFAIKESERSQAAQKLLGKVPYLNGGIFLRHQIEELHGKEIHIADPAFEKLFDFFEQYQWHLDERPLRQDNEINPDVLGYIFEKYINQKQMGAYYTKEDITGYISQNTVIPFLFDAARQKCKIAFDGEHSIWRLLQADPDRYIYEAVRRGVIDEKGNIIPESRLPDFVQKGMKDPKARMFDRRYNLGEADLRDSKGKKLTLPTETWREYVHRRQRCLELRQKLTAGEIREINDLITYNLDIRQFAQDVIENSEGPELLRAFWHAIEKITVLDPTVGSGAFLFAALNILEPLYEACLDRMEVFLAELESSGERHRPEKFGDFRKVLERIAQHPNPRYFVLKSIIINNLYGVDVMEEAVEICKLRLFLKLVAQVERADNIEPLPDIDFNIRAGNTLVGFATLENVRNAISSESSGQAKMQFDDTFQRIDEKAQGIDRLFDLFRQQQTELRGEVARSDKDELRNRLKSLDAELNRYLGKEYGVDINKKANYERWLNSHKPFHWFIEFYGIMKRGGFDAIIGNPPYVEISDVSDQYTIRDLKLSETGNLYAVCVERFAELVSVLGRCGVIVPISSVSTPRMVPLMKLLADTFSTLHLSNFAVRPGKLFVGTDMNLTIILGLKSSASRNRVIWTTKYNRWQEEYRPFLFEDLTYGLTSFFEDLGSIPKVGSAADATLLQKVFRFPPLSRINANANGDLIFYHSGGRYFRKCIRERLSNEYKPLAVRKELVDTIICLLSSSFFYWLWITISDCYHVTKRDVHKLPMPDSLGLDSHLKTLADRLLSNLYQNAKIQLRNRADGSQRKEINFQMAHSKEILDDIDRGLASHYSLTAEELDFLTNYDAKFRGVADED